MRADESPHEKIQRVATSRGGDMWQLAGGEAVKFAATMWVIGILFLGTAAAGRAIRILGNDLPALKSRFARIALALVWSRRPRPGCRVHR